jgi:putative oxidoreductase
MSGAMNSVAAKLAHPVLVRAAQLAIGLVFLAAALAKIGDMPYFAQQVGNYRLAPMWAVNLLAMTMPWIELVTGLALVVGPRRRAGAALAFAFMLVFTVAVGAAWARGLDFNCGCFGKAGAGAIGASKFAENLGFTLLALLAFLPPRR